MKPKLIALNILLLGALGVIAWEGRERWLEAKAERRQSLSVAAKPAPTAALKPAPAPAAAQSVQYADVATKNLFAQDRNPNVIIDPPKVEAPKPMPPLPVIYGVLGLPSGTKAIMAAKAGGNGKAVHTGDDVGEFRIVALDPKTIELDWNGEKISRSVDDLMDRSGNHPAGESQGPAVAAVAAPQAAAPSLGPGKADDPAQTDRPCVAGDKSPAGTVVDGYKKAYAAAVTPFGPMGCHWTPVK